MTYFMLTLVFKVVNLWNIKVYNWFGIFIKSVKIPVAELYILNTYIN